MRSWQFNFGHFRRNKIMKAKWFGRLWPVVAAVATVAVAAVWLNLSSSNAAVPEIVVYKTPTCGCCDNWIAHLRDSGLNVSVVNVPSTEPIHERFGVPRRLASCHTGVIGEYWVEGHVPADLVQKLLEEKPDGIVGIAVPGMPMGSPGMESPNPVEYQVLAYGRDGKVTLYATRQGQTSPR
jgi:hypothetical protein